MATLCRCLHSPGDKPVQNGLTLSPSQAYELTKQGRPITSSELPASFFEEGTLNCSFDVPLHQRRGVDFVDVWTSLQDQHKKIKSNFDFTRYE